MRGANENYLNIN